MSVPYEDKIFAEHSDFNSIRDSFYLLSTMNQFTMRPTVRQKKEAEGLLRITLFSKDIRLLKPEVKQTEPATTRPPKETRLDSDLADLEPEGYLNTVRQNLAQEMRQGRKRGVVPVFISTAWFLFSLGLSIQSAFGLLGQNATAHDLALGCLLSWLPVLILGSIVDRNPVAADDIRNKLNDLVDRVRRSLMNEAVRDMYLGTIHNREQKEVMRRWVQTISSMCPFLNDFFVDFAGQGRIRWHYGCCHPIIRDIERSYLAAEGRDWLHSEQEARTLLVLGIVHGGLDWVDYRELWQILGSVIVVGGTIFGAFILSYFTPTVGLGCRSGGYVIFWSISSGLLIAEILAWWIIDAQKPWFKRLVTSLSSRITISLKQMGVHDRYLRVRTATKRHVSTLVSTLRQGLLALLTELMSQPNADKIENIARGVIDRWQLLETQEQLDYLVFKPVEAVNTAWLLYITLAQTVGAYVNCKCMTSSWGGKNYMDFTQYTTTTSKWVKFYWISGATVSVLTMTGAMIYIVVQWLMQSHLATAQINKAARGLQRTRQFRRLLSPFDEFVELTVAMPVEALVLLRIKKAVPTNQGQPTSLKWTKSITCKKHHHDPNKPDRRSTEQGQHSRMPSVTVQDTEGQPLITEPDDYTPYEHSSGTPSPRSSYEMPTMPTPTRGSRPREYSLLPTQRSTFERRPSNEDLTGAFRGYEPP